MDNKIKLIEQIESYRNKMMELSTKKELSSNAVLEVSIELDALLNEYNKLIKS